MHVQLKAINRQRRVITMEQRKAILAQKAQVAKEPDALDSKIASTPAADLIPIQVLDI